MHPAFKEVGGWVLGWGFIAVLALLLFSPAIGLAVLIYIETSSAEIAVAGGLLIALIIIDA